MRTSIRGAAVAALAAIITTRVAFGVAGDITVVDLQDLTLPAQSFYNGSDGAGSFTSRGAVFSNEFTDFGGGFTVWSGFSYSNTTDKTTAGFGNQYSSFAGGGAAQDGTVVAGGIYAVGCYDVGTGAPVVLALPKDQDRPLSLQICNSTYTALSMLNGDGFAKKFGGATGNDADFLLLTIKGLASDGSLLGSVDFYLADYRFADNSQDYMVSTWQTVDLSGLGSGVSTLAFTMASSDVGTFGMNTPAYFTLDNVKATTSIPEPSVAWLGLVALALPALRHRRLRQAGKNRA